MSTLTLNTKLDALLTAQGISARTITLIKASDTAIDNLNRFANNIKVDTLVGDDFSISDAARNRVRIDPGIGTFAHTDANGPYINIDPAMLVREHDVWVAFVLSHEARHTLQKGVLISSASNPVDYAIRRSMNEGDSLYAEWTMRRELFGSGIAPDEGLPYFSFLGQPFKGDPVENAVVVKQLAGEIDAYYRELTRVGASIDGPMTEFMARLNREYSRPSTEPNLTYYQQDTRDYLARSSGLEQINDSYSYLPVPKDSDFVLNPNGSWSADWIIPATGSRPAMHILRDSRGTVKKYESIDGKAWKVSTLTDSNADGAPDTLTISASPVIATVDASGKTIFSEPTASGEISYRITLADSGEVVVRGIQTIDGQAVFMPSLDAAIASFGMDANTLAVGGPRLSQGGDGRWSLQVTSQSGTITAVVQIFDDGSSQTTSQLAGGITRTVTRDENNAVTRITDTQTRGTETVSRTVDASGNLVSQTFTEALSGGGREVTVLAADGGYVRTKYAADGSVLGRREVTAFDIKVMNQTTVMNDLTSLVNAIKAGAPLPTAVSGIKLLNDTTSLSGNNIPYLNTTSAVASGILSLYNLDQAFENGDDFTKFQATLGAVHAVNVAYQAVYQQVTGTAVTQGLSTGIKH